MSQITIASAAYVPSTPASILAAMEKNLSITASSDGLVVVNRESVQDFLDNNNPSELKDFLNDSLATIDSMSTSPVGEIFFIN